MRPFYRLVSANPISAEGYTDLDQGREASPWLKSPLCRADSARVKMLVGALLVGSLLSGCGSGKDLDSVSSIPHGGATVAKNMVSSVRIVHEAQLQGELKADFSRQVILDHLETSRPHPGDSGGPGDDLLPFQNPGGLLNLVLDSDLVVRAEVLDARGNSLAVLKPGLNSLDLPPGELQLRLISARTREAMLAIGQRPQPTVRALQQPGIYIQELGAFPVVQGADTADTLFIGAGPARSRQLILSYEQFTQIFGYQVTPLGLAVYQFFLNGGRTALVQTVDSTGGLGQGLAAGLTASQGASFNLLVIPELGLLDPGDADSLSSTALALASSQNAVLLLDLPRGVTTSTQAQNWLASHDQLRQNEVAAFWPWVSVTAPDGSTALVGASSTMAGVCATVDSQVGVWQAPAGLAYPLRNVQMVGSNPQTVENLNSIWSENQAVVCWGAHTLGNQAIGPQRLLNYIEISLKSGLEWTVFEPSGPVLYQSVAQSVAQFMTTLWQQGALFGDTSSQAFQVTCDVSNNPPLNQYLGILSVGLRYAPVFPGQFEILSLTTRCAPPD